ncbi:MAG: hypothetical protein ACFNZS_01805 [Ottowia sp.]
MPLPAGAFGPLIFNARYSSNGQIWGELEPMRAGYLLPPDAFTRPPHAVRHDAQLNLF